MTVLVVEDDVVTLKLIASILEKNGYQVEARSSAMDAITFLQQGGSVYLIISDIIMPGVDGFYFPGFLKAHGELSKVPVILCTSLADQQSKSTGIKGGATDYIVKPINPKVLIAKVKQALGQEAADTVDTEQAVDS